MKYPQIITEFDQNDAYKFFMGYAIFKLHDGVKCKFKFFNRGNHKFPIGFDKELRKQVDGFAELRFTKEMKDFFEYNFRQPDGTPLFSPAYYSFLENFRFHPESVKIEQYDNGELNIEIEDLWSYVSMFEVPLMTTIVELRNRMLGYYEQIDWKKADHDDKLKLDAIGALNVKCSEFGLRRAAFIENQTRFYKLALEYAPNVITGTSNVNLARITNTKPHGTVAHEWFMFYASMFGVSHANEQAMKSWVKIYRGAASTVLPDTYTVKEFMKSFDSYYAKLYDSSRWDSGSYKTYTDMFIDKYKSHNIDPLSKSIYYTNGINSIAMLRDIQTYCGCIPGEFPKKRINTGFGVGTWFTNDLSLISGEKLEALNIVIKMVAAKPINMDWKFTVKISDDIGKITSIDKRTTERYLEELGLENNK